MSDNYYDIPALSASGINAFSRSPMHYWKESPFNPQRKVREDTPALILGKVAHKLALEPDTFNDEYAVAPKCDKRTKKGKADYEEFLLTSDDKTVIEAEIYSKAIEMQNALTQNAAVRKLMSVGDSEYPLFWDNGIIKCKAKADRYREGLLIDYKTSDDASEEAFSRSIAKWGYHRQDAWYMDGFEAVHGERPRGFVFIVQEKEIPENIGIYSIIDSDREIGAMENIRAANAIADRLEKGHWKSFPEMIINVRLPSWYAR